MHSKLTYFHFLCFKTMKQSLLSKASSSAKILVQDMKMKRLTNVSLKRSLILSLFLLFICDELCK